MGVSDGFRWATREFLGPSKGCWKAFQWLSGWFRRSFEGMQRVFRGLSKKLQRFFEEVSRPSRGSDSIRGLSPETPLKPHETTSNTPGTLLDLLADPSNALETPCERLWNPSKLHGTSLKTLETFWDWNALGTFSKPLERSWKHLKSLKHPKNAYGTF